MERLWAGGGRGAAEGPDAARSTRSRAASFFMACTMLSNKELRRGGRGGGGNKGVCSAAASSAWAAAEPRSSGSAAEAQLRDGASRQVALHSARPFGRGLHSSPPLGSEASELLCWSASARRSRSRTVGAQTALVLLLEGQSGDVSVAVNEFSPFFEDLQCADVVGKAAASTSTSRQQQQRAEAGRPQFIFGGSSGDDVITQHCTVTSLSPYSPLTHLGPEECLRGLSPSSPSRRQHSLPRMSLSAVPSWLRISLFSEK